MESGGGLLQQSSHSRPIFAELQEWNYKKLLVLKEILAVVLAKIHFRH